MNRREFVALGLPLLTTNGLRSLNVNDVSVSPGKTSAVVQWKTDKPSSSRVRYGLASTLTKHVDDSSLVTFHRLTVPLLQPGTKYYFRCLSYDANGKFAQSSVSTFTTTQGTMPTLPTLPTTFSVPYSLPTGGTTWTVHAADNLQTVFDSAALGDVIVLDAGATWTGNFKLPVKSGSGWLYVISSNMAGLPLEHHRVVPADASAMPCITAASGLNRPIVSFFENAHNYRFVGIEIKNASTISNFNLVVTGYGGNYADASYQWTAVTTDAKLPSYIVFDRCYIHNVTTYPIACRCGWLMNGHYMAAVDCCFKNFIDGSDAQAINIFQGTGPYKIVNNYLEATGENFMIGGSDPSITDANAEDVEFKANYLYKDKDTWAGHWTIKNLFELKNGRRVLCEGNYMDNCYVDHQGQGATAIVLTVRNQGGNNDNAQLQDITIRYNRIHTCGKGWRLTGYDNFNPTLQTQRVLIEHNAIDDLSTPYTSSPAGFYYTTVIGPILDITDRHNLILCKDETVLISQMIFMDASAGVFAVENWLSENNIYTHGDYGAYGNGAGSGNACFNRFVKGHNNATPEFKRNVVINRTRDLNYSVWKAQVMVYGGVGVGQNAVADGISAVGFTNFAGGDYSLSSSSPYHNWGNDGTDPGPDWSVLTPKINAALSGTPEESVVVADIIASVSRVIFGYATQRTS